MSNYYETEAPEASELTGQLINTEALMAQTSSEIDRQIATAKAYPRSIDGFLKLASRLVAYSPQTAASCIYALPRGKEKNARSGQWEQKIIKGPTARFAEAMAQAWGNCRCGSRIIGEDEQFVTAQGFFHDVEANVAIQFEVKRRITDSEGRRYSPDMVAVTANAACSIALRNAVLKGIPQSLWRETYTLAERAIMGDSKTLVDRRREVFDLFKAYGLTQAMVAQLAGASGPADIVGEHLVALQGMLTALKDGDVTVESLLAGLQEHSVAEKGKAGIAEIKRKYQAPPDQALGGSVPRDAAVPEQAGPPTSENLDAEPEEGSVRAEAKAAQAKVQKEREKRSGKEPSQVQMTEAGLPLKEPF